jgi:hypothetical protein
MNYKRDFDYSLLNIAPAVKNKESGEWVCDLSFEGKDFLVSTPRVKIQENSLVFKTENKKVFMDFIDKLEANVIQHLFDNSIKIFKGKKFSLEKIKSSLVPSILLSEDGRFACLETETTEDIRCFSPFGEEIARTDVQKYVTAHIKVNSIVFLKELFHIRYSIVVLKMSKIELTNVEEFVPVVDPVEDFEITENASGSFFE